MKSKALTVCLLAMALSGVSGVQANPTRLNTHSKGVRSTNHGSSSKASGKTFKATLTTYWAIGKGADSYTRKFISSTGDKLESGVTVAADPSIFPYGTIFEIEGLGRREVRDTGAHVIKRVASRNRGVNYPVIDVFFARREDALRFANKGPVFAQIKVIRLGDES